jgi:ATP-dependent Lhr-like helicase
VLYVSPLKALSNDIRVNLQGAAGGHRRQLARHGPAAARHPHRGAHRRHTTAERNAMRKRAPHILVTTPESLYVLLGSDSGRAMLATCAP